MNYSVTIEAILKENKKAERLLFDNLAPELMIFCKRYAKDNHQAKDFFQECFIRIFEKLPLYNSNKGQFKAWVYTLCRNVVLGQLKPRKQEVTINLMEHLPDDILKEDDIDYLSDLELLSCIRQLPDKYRTIINLYIFEKMKHSEIGTLLNMSEATSRSQYLRAKGLLKSILIKKIPDLYERKLV